jgi:hypothetical protein
MHRLLKMLFPFLVLKVMYMLILLSVLVYWFWIIGILLFLLIFSSVLDYWYTVTTCNCSEIILS